MVKATEDHGGRARDVTQVVRKSQMTMGLTGREIIHIYCPN